MLTKKSLATTLIVALLVISQAGCKTIDTVIDAIEEAAPILQSAGVNSPYVQQAVDLARQFKQNPQAATLSALALAFEKLTEDAQKISDQTKRTLTLVALAAGHIALKKLAQKYVDTSSSVPMARRGGAQDANVIGEYARKPNWKCRNASTGRYEKMEFCKANPANSVVER